MSVQGFIVRYVTHTGDIGTTEVFAPTSTDAIEITLGPEYARRVQSARLSVRPGGLARAAYRVAREHARNPWDEDTERGFVTVLDAVANARNTLRLPESPYVPGGYPLEDDGSDVATAYRVILEATQEEIDAAEIGPEASVKVPR